MPDKKLLQFCPLADGVIVELLKPEAKTAAGLLLPETIKDKPQHGWVVAAGPGRWDDDGKKNALKCRYRRALESFSRDTRARKSISTTKST